MNIQEYELMNILADERYKTKENCLKNRILFGENQQCAENTG